MFRCMFSLPKCGSCLWCNTFQEPAVQYMVKKSFVRLRKLKETQFMVAVTNSSNSLHIEKCDCN